MPYNNENGNRDYTLLLQKKKKMFQTEALNLNDSYISTEVGRNWVTDVLIKKDLYFLIYMIYRLNIHNIT